MSAVSSSSSQSINRKQLQEIMEYSYAEIEAITNSFQTVLGEGGFGTVYKGQLDDCKSVAVKVFKNHDEKAFLSELKNLTYISHPNVTAVCGLCHETKLCTLTEFMGKGSLQDTIDEKDGCMQLDRSQILRIFIQLCKTLHDFHKKNFFHLDIKPSNILFDIEGNPKYSDFNGSYFFDEARTSYTLTHGGYTQGYMDPFSLHDGSFGYYTDVYAFGITILAVLTKRKNIGFIVRDGRERSKNNNIDNLKGYFTEEWCDEIGIKMLSCAMECTKDDRKSRIGANELAKELEEIKFEMDTRKVIEDIIGISLKNSNLSKDIADKVPCIIIRTKDNYETPNELAKKLSCIANVEYGLFGFKFKRKEKIDTFNIVPQDEEDKQSKNVFMLHDVDIIEYILKSIKDLSISIVFCNIEILNVVEPLVVENDIKLASNNNNLKLNITKENYILIRGKVKVEMINFKIEDCDRTNQDNHAFHLKNGTSLCMKDVIFRNNINYGPIIYVDSSCKLEMKDCTFEGNKNSREGFPSCINSKKESQVTLKACSIKNHKSFEAPYEHLYFLIASSGHMSISNCTFENNLLNDKSIYPSIVFKGKAEVTITNSIFKKCSMVYFGDKSKAVIKECRFEENGIKKCPGGAFGLNDDAEVELNKCFFINNIACQGGAIACRDKSKISIKKTIFDGNKTFHEEDGAGGAMLLNNESSGKVEGCRFINNYAIIYGGALAMWRQSKLEIKRCYFENNVSSNGRGHSIYCSRKSNIKEMVDNVYKDNTEGERSNVYIWKMNE